MNQIPAMSHDEVFLFLLPWPSYFNTQSGPLEMSFDKLR